ncbi:lipoprotein [Streptomyces flaveolus]|nr:lipoprotein [Streptomyces flaveolus]
MRGNLRSSAVAERARPARVTRVHRTTTTATLLVTVAVSALSGCTTVQPASGPADGARPSAGRPDGPADPRVVQAPAREALEMIGPTPSPGDASEEPRRTARPTAPARSEPPAARPEPRSRPARPEAPRRPGGTSQKPRVEAPDVPSLTGGGTGTQSDVCSLGRQYGGWRPGSPEAAICEQTYGR